MFVNVLSGFRVINVSSSKLRPLKKLFSEAKSLGSHKFFSHLEKDLHKTERNHITFASVSTTYCISTSQKNILLKAMSGEDGRNNPINVIDYDELVKAQNDENTWIIDVRDPCEIEETQQLPGSIHIPVYDIPNAISLSDESFQEMYNKKKPCLDCKIIVSCRSGKRSTMVQQYLMEKGYKRVYNYVGGFLDWSERNRT